MLWVAGGVALFPVGAAIGDETMNDTESLLPTGSESGADSRLLKAGFEFGETAPALLVYRSRSELLTVPQWREIAALARHAAKVPRIYSEGVRAERPHDARTHR